MIRLYVFNMLRKIADRFVIRLALWHLSLHGWRTRRSLTGFIEGSRLPGPTIVKAGAGQAPGFGQLLTAHSPQPRATAAQAAIEYIVVAATLGLLVLFSGDFVQKIQHSLNESFTSAVGKMVPPPQ